MLTKTSIGKLLVDMKIARQTLHRVGAGFKGVARIACACKAKDHPIKKITTCLIHNKLGIVACFGGATDLSLIACTPGN